jgi:hypothetical protein
LAIVFTAIWGVQNRLFRRTIPDMAIQKTGLLGARWKLNANNHRKAHVLFDGLYRDVDSLLVQFWL